MKDKVFNFLSKRIFCVISSVNSELKPESAFVGYHCNDLFEFFIGTSKQSRKIKNISQNPQVSIVVADEVGSVQYEGVARVIDNSDSEVKLLPGYKKYRDDPMQTWIKVTPSWIRFIQHGDNDLITELTEFS